MQEIHGTASQQVGARPEVVFGVITDIARLPEWNDAIEGVIERPPELTAGAEWVVKMHPNRVMSWKSRSRVATIDMEARCFAYRTWNADGNPSYADWKWEVVPIDSVAQVTVSWDVYLKTLDRKFLAGPIRQRQLRKEVAGSLHALDHVAAQRLTASAYLPHWRAGSGIMRRWPTRPGPTTSPSSRRWIRSRRRRL